MPALSVRKASVLIEIAARSRSTSLVRTRSARSGFRLFLERQPNPGAELALGQHVASEVVRARRARVGAEELTPLAHHVEQEPGVNAGTQVLDDPDLERRFERAREVPFRFVPLIARREMRCSEPGAEDAADATEA